VSQPQSLGDSEPEDAANSAENRRSWHGWVMGLLPVAISAVLLIVLVGKTEALEVIWNADWRWLVPAFAISFSLNEFLGAWKWRQVMRSMGIEAGYWEVWRLWLGLAVTSFMPFQSGHLMYVVALKKAKDIRYTEAFECVAYDRFLTLVATCALVVVGQLVVDPDHQLANPIILIGASSFVLIYFLDVYVFAILARIPFVRRHSSLVHSRWGYGRKLQLLAAAIVYQCSDLISFSLACLCIGVVVDPLVVLSVLPMVILLAFLPVTMNGFGAREGLLTLFLAAQLTSSEAVAAGILLELLEYVGPALLGLFVLRGLLRTLARPSSSESSAEASE